MAEVVLPLTPHNILDTCSLCIKFDDLHACQVKVAWAEEIARQTPEGILGYITYQTGKPVGAVEVLPASVVPYPLPHKSPEIAFITCLYSLEHGLDYRGQLLDQLMKYLPGAGYREVQVISGPLLPYPNGPSEIFMRYGFDPIEKLDRIVVSEGEDDLILMMRKLSYCLTK